LQRFFVIQEIAAWTMEITPRFASQLFDKFGEVL
jgi:hypothetical protein